MPRGARAVEQTSYTPIILLAGAGLRLKKDLSGSKGLARVGEETFLSLQLKRFNKDFQKPLVVIRQEERIFYENYLAERRLDALLVVDENPIGPPSSLKVAIEAIGNKTTIVIVTLGDSVCTSNRILEYVRALENDNGAIAIARTNVNNIGSSAIIYRGGRLLGLQTKASKASWRWAGTVVISFK